MNDRLRCYKSGTKPSVILRAINRVVESFGFEPWTKETIPRVLPQEVRIAHERAWKSWERAWAKGFMVDPNQECALFLTIFGDYWEERGEPLTVEEQGGLVKRRRRKLTGEEAADTWRWWTKPQPGR